MRVFISQPTYLSWIGYLASMDCSDIYVVYDDVQFEHQSWQHRNKIRCQESWMWLTVPIIRNQGQLINEVKIDGVHWQKEHWKSIIQYYSNTPYFKDYRGIFETIYKNEWERLVDINTTLILQLAVMLNIKMPQVIKSSELATSGNKTDRLIPILKAVGATEFIEGMAGKEYLEVDKMNKAGIDVFWFDYKHPVYPQKGKQFIPYLSAIDLLFNTGEKAIDYIRQGVNLVKA